MKEVVLAIKPKYAQDILNGTKTVELRKRFRSDIERIFLYATAPEKAIIGCVDVKNIQHKPSSEIWETHHDKVGITEQEFYKYFGGRWGVAVEVYNPVYFSHGIEHHRLKSEFGIITPQSYCYCDGLSEKLDIK